MLERKETLLIEKSKWQNSGLKRGLKETCKLIRELKSRLNEMEFRYTSWIICEEGSTRKQSTKKNVWWVTTCLFQIYLRPLTKLDTQTRPPRIFKNNFEDGSDSSCPYQIRPCCGTKSCRGYCGKTKLVSEKAAG